MEMIMMSAKNIFSSNEKNNARLVPYNLRIVEVSRLAQRSMCTAVVRLALLLAAVSEAHLFLGPRPPLSSSSVRVHWSSVI